MSIIMITIKKEIGVKRIHFFEKLCLQVSLREAQLLVFSS